MLRPGMGGGGGSGVPRGVGADYAHLAERIADRGCTLGKPLHLEAEVSSTNDLAKDAARSGAPHGTTFVAEAQTHGRGRQGRSWLASRGESILVSVVLRVACPVRRLPTLSLACGLAARDAIAKATRTVPMVKWPNDVWLDGKKVAGVLVEGLLQGDQANAIIVGVGINVHARAFDPAIVAIATSVALHAREEAPPERAVILADLLAALDRDVGLVAARGVGLIHSRLTQYDALRGLRVHGDGDAPGDPGGVAEGIDLEGRLLVRRDDGALARFGAGEVHLARGRSEAEG